MNKDGLGFRDLFVYVMPGGLYLIAALAWYPAILQTITTQHVALISLGFIFIAYSIGFSAYWLSYLLRYILPGWKEENTDTIIKIIHVMKEYPDFYKDEIFRYRNLCRVCLSLSLPFLALGASWSIALFNTQRVLSIVCAIVCIVTTSSFLYRARRYNKRYLLQVELSYTELFKNKVNHLD